LDYSRFKEITQMTKVVNCLLNSSPIEELGKGALGMVELGYEPQAEHAHYIHGNPERSNHLAPSH